MKTFTKFIAEEVYTTPNSLTGYAITGVLVTWKAKNNKKGAIKTHLRKQTVSYPCSPNENMK